MNAVPSWRLTMNISGPDELSRSTTTVAAGRGLVTIGPGAAALTVHNSS